MYVTGTLIGMMVPLPKIEITKRNGPTALRIVAKVNVALQANRESVTTMDKDQERELQPSPKL